MYTLRPYQQEAVERTLHHFRRSREPALIVLPTGAGKSLVIAELARIAKGRVLVLAHVKELVEQNHEKFITLGESAGIYSAGLGKKESNHKVIFGGIQSVARAEKSFFEDFSIVIVDECHRISGESATQYTETLRAILNANKMACVLGFTATPYRLDTGWIYRTHIDGHIRTEQDRFFGKCLFEVSLEEMIKNGYLTQPVQIDAPVAGYDFSNLWENEPTRTFRLEDIERILKDQSRITPTIIQNIVELSEKRRGVIIFTSTVKHAKEVLSMLPQGASALITGETPHPEREQTIKDFKEKKIKFLVNVSVLTTGFDAPHVDLIAILRPTESVSLYQQIVGRGLRLFKGKKDCLVLDYTGVPHDLFQPEIGDRKPTPDATLVKVECPKCQHENEFWGVLNDEEELVEHFGKKCKGAKVSLDSNEIIPCGFRYRCTICEHCQTENDYGVDNCVHCGKEIADESTVLARARSHPESHVMRPDSMTLEKKIDKTGRERLEVRYYDHDGESLSEVFFFGKKSDSKVFHYNFARFHLKIPEHPFSVSSPEEAITHNEKFRTPMFVVARKQGKYWRVREKIFR